MEYRLIDVKSIKCHTPRNGFFEEDLTVLADSILECGGLLKPIVLRVLALDSYEVISGEFEYWAAVVAQEKDPRKGEMINAFVVGKKEEGSINKQLALVSP